MNLVALARGCICKPAAAAPAQTVDTVPIDVSTVAGPGPALVV
jgi:hypothetical protein